MLKKFLSWLSFFLDYLAAVLIFISLNKFFWLSEVFYEGDVGVPILILVFFVLASMMALFVMVFWHDNQVLNKRLKIGKPCLFDHVVQSGGFYIVLLILFVFFLSSDFFAVVTFVPILVTFLAIFTNAYYLYRKGGRASFK